MTNKSLGQYFLKNRSAIRSIVAALDSQTNETIVEIGPGHGELTMGLRIANCESRIIVIEKDKKLCECLKNLKIDGLEIMHGDALEILPELISALQNSGIAKYKLVGNIPYYITGRLLRIVGELPEGSKPERCVFTIQKEVAERIIIKAGKMNRLAASVAYWADAKIVMSLSQKDFVPAPKVTSAILVLDRKREPVFPDQNRYYAAMRALFSQPRKIVLNNLAGRGNRTKEVLSANLRGLGIDPECRPQDLLVEDVAKIAEAFPELSKSGLDNPR